MFLRSAVATLVVLGGCAAAPAAFAQASPARSQAAFASDRIAVTVRGSGPDVILIPGLGSAPRVWAGTVAAAPGYRYHPVQVKGFAGVPAEANATGPVAAEIARYVRARCLKRPAVVGHSMGGTIGMMLAARNPDAVGKLMVVDMTPFMGPFFGQPNGTVETLRPIAEQIRSELSGPPTPQGQAMLARTIDGMINTAAERPAVIADSRRSDRPATGNSYYELVTTDLRPELRAIRVPTTVLYVRPAAVPITDAQVDATYRAMYANLTQATLTQIPDSAHFIMFDQPARFRQELKAFLEK